MEELRRKVDNIEYKDIKSLREKVEKVEIELAKNNLITQQNTEAMNKMSNTMDSVRETMIQISDAIEYTNKTNKELAENIRQQNTKIDKIQLRQDVYDEHMEKIQKEINDNEEKSKIDIRTVIKASLPTIVIIIGFISYIIFYK